MRRVTHRQKRHQHVALGIRRVAFRQDDGCGFVIPLPYPNGLPRPVHIEARLVLLRARLLPALDELFGDAFDRFGPVIGQRAPLNLRLNFTLFVRRQQLQWRGLVVVRGASLHA